MFQQVLFKTVHTEIWVVIVLLVCAGVFLLVFSAFVLHGSSGGGRYAVLTVVPFQIARTTFKCLRVFIPETPKMSVLEREERFGCLVQRFPGEAGFTFFDSAGTRADAAFPYLLLARIDGNLNRGVVELVDLNARKTLHRWDGKEGKEGGRIQSPWLLPDGSVLGVDYTRERVIRIDRRSRLLWTSEREGDCIIHHHSLKLDHEQNIWVCGHLYPPSVSYGRKNLWDDALVKLSAKDGSVLFKKSILEIFDENHLQFIFRSPLPLENDPVHLNDIQPVFEDGPFWKQGDCFVSAKHRSLVFLYRPRTNTVLWHRIGPWIRQHDVTILDENRISVFDNHIPATEKNITPAPEGIHNNLVVVDFRTGEVSTPFQKGFERLALGTYKRGRARIVGKNQAFVEETADGRLIQFNQDGKPDWQFINRADDGIVYPMKLSQPVPGPIGDAVKALLQKTACP